MALICYPFALQSITHSISHQSINQWNDEYGKTNNYFLIFLKQYHTIVHKHFLKFIFCMLCVRICMCIQEPAVISRGHWRPWNCSYRQLWAAMSVLGTEPRSFAKSVLSHLSNHHCTFLTKREKKNSTFSGKSNTIFSFLFVHPLNVYLLFLYWTFKKEDFQAICDLNSLKLMGLCKRLNK